MFGITYGTWEKICDMYFSLGEKTQKSYLQWFPFSKLSDSDKAEIGSKDFFDKCIALPERLNNFSSLVLLCLPPGR